MQSSLQTRDAVRHKAAARRPKPHVQRQIDQLVTYTNDMPSEGFDAIGILQAVQHADDWRETGAEMARLLKPGGTLMLAEITFSPRLKMLAEQDIHLQCWVEKIASRLGLDPYNAPYYSAAELEEALKGNVSQIESLIWKGIEIVWGQKPR